MTARLVAAEAPPRPLAFSRAEAARALGLSLDAFEEHVISELRVVRVGRRILVPVKELERYLDRHAARPLEAELSR